MDNDLSPEKKALMAQFDFKYSYGYSSNSGAERQYKAEYKGLTLFTIVWTARNKASGDWGKGRATYAIGKEKKEYRDLSEFLDVVIQRTSLKITP